MAKTPLTNYLNQRFVELKERRSPFEGQWAKIAEYFAPNRSRSGVYDHNKGLASWEKIINNAGGLALRTATAGMLAGVMSPSRPWFALEPEDRSLLQDAAVRQWLHDVRELMLSVFNKSNLYRHAPSMFSELLLFGTGAMTHEDDNKVLARFMAHTAGSYYLDLDQDFDVGTFAREFQMTVQAAVRRFGKENMSQWVKNEYDQGNYSTWVTIRQLIEPNIDTNDNLVGKQFPWRSIYFECGENGKGEPKNLEANGFYEFPVYAPRWAIIGEDIYGSDSPGMFALGDMVSLQLLEEQKAIALAKQVNPPVVGPASLQGPPDLRPGGMSVADGLGAGASLQPVYQVTPQLADMMQEITNVGNRIRDAFYHRQFMAISEGMEGVQPRNELEIVERKQEALLQLGQVLEQLHGEFLDRLVDRTLAQLKRAELLPEPPEALSGQPLKVIYISTLAMAQRAVRGRAIERAAMFGGQLVQMGLWDGLGFNGDAAFTEYSSAHGTPPSIIVPNEEVIAQRQEQQQQAAQQMQMENMKTGAQAAQAAAAAPVGEGTILDRVMEQGGNRGSR